MSDDKPLRTGKESEQRRKDRLAAELRANLTRRKDQTRARAGGGEAGQSSRSSGKEED